MNRGCLVVIDVQQALVDEGPEDAGPFLDRLAKLLAAARASGTPVLHVQHSGPVGDELEPETRGWEITAVAAPQDGEPVFAKHYNSAFRSTGLEDWLRTRRIETLVMCGMQTEHCLDASIKSAFERGFQVVVPEDAHTTFANGGLSAAQLREFYQNRIWKDRYAAVNPVDEVIAGFAANEFPGQPRRNQDAKGRGTVLVPIPSPDFSRPSPLRGSILVADPTTSRPGPGSPR